MRNSSRRSKTPLPLTQSAVGLGDATQDMVDSSLEEQVGGGRQPHSPPVETPTRLRTHIKPSERARDNVILQQAGLRRALMGEVTEGYLSQPPVSSATNDANATPGSLVTTQSSANFLGPQSSNSHFTPSNAFDGLTLSVPVTAPPNDHATCSDSQTVPTMRVIPPTPVPVGDALSSGPTNAGPSTPTSGRRTATVNAILTAGYDDLEVVLIQLIEQTNLTVQQILDGWHKSYSRTVNGINHWNQYTKYAMRHEEQERRRLGLPPDVPHSIRSELYLKFKEDNPDTWQEILEVHDMIDNIQCSPQTIAQRAQAFNKAKKRVTSMLKNESAKHGFEAVIIMCGSVANEDASLGFTHTMGGAMTFFETRCRANSTTMIGHLKSHVFNHVSLETVKEAFGNEGSQLPALAALRAPPAPLDGGEEHMNDDIMTNIKDSMIALLQSVGGDVSKFKRSTFPWTTLLNFLATQGLVMKGWPDGVLMPGQLRHSGARTKGIADLTNAERRRLQQALLAGQITTVKLSERDERRAVSEFNAPVVIGAPPPYDSTRAKAQQMYGNGTFDFDGPERLPPTAAATRIKQKQVPKATYSDPIVISGSSSDGGPRVIPAKKKRNAAIEGKKKVIITLDSSDDEVDIVDENEHSLRVIDTNESLEEDYQDVADSCKRKAKKPVPAINSTQSKKGDERKRPTKGVKKFKSAKYVEVSDSDTDKTVQARRVSASKVHPACEKDLFDGAETVPRTVPGIFLPSTLKELDNTERLLEPSSPSPKRHVPLAPLTEFDTSRRSPENDVTVAAPCKVVGSVPTAPSAQVAVEPRAPSMPLCEAVVPHASVPTEIPTTTGAVAGMTVPLANPTSFPPTTVVPSLPTQNPCDERFTYSDWMNQTRQAGGGHSSHAFHPSQPPFISYHENDGGTIAPTQMQRRVVGMQRAMYLNSGVYPEDIYGGDVRGDPRGPYGGFCPRVDDSAMYPGARDPFWGVRPSPHPLPSRRSSVALSDTQHALGMRPSPHPHPVPGPSRLPSIHLPPCPHPCTEGREPAT